MSNKEIYRKLGATGRPVGRSGMIHVYPTTADLRRGLAEKDRFCQAERQVIYAWLDYRRRRTRRERGRYVRPWRAT